MNKAFLVSVGWVLIGVAMGDTISAAIPAQLTSIGGLSRKTTLLSAGALLIYLNR